MSREGWGVEQGDGGGRGAGGMEKGSRGWGSRLEQQRGNDSIDPYA